MTTVYEFEHVMTPSGWLSPGWLAVNGNGDIERVTDRRPENARPVRVTGHAIPGLPNLHSHAFQRAMAGLAERGSREGDSFWSWRQVMYGFVQRLMPEDVETIAAQLYIEMLKAGYTAVGEFHYLHHDKGGSPFEDPAEMAERVIAAAQRTGIGITVLPVLYMAGGFGGAPPGAAQRRFLNDPDGLLAIVETLRRRHGADLQIRVGIAPHSLRAVPAEALTNAVAALDAIDGAAPIHIHAAEQIKEVEDCLAWSGRRPVEWLLEHAAVGPSWCLVHATHMTDNETAALARSGAVAGLCPTTEANLGDGLFPLRACLGAGGRFGVGSDSHVSVSPAEELRWLEYGQRLIHRTRNVAAGAGPASTGAVLYRGALAGGAQALGRRIGALAPGHRADVVVLDGDHPAITGRTGNLVLDGLVFTGNVSPVRAVMVGGAWVVEDGRHPGEVAAAAAYRRVVSRLIAD